MMTEPDVALTDYGLAIESGVFAWLLINRGSGRGGPLGRWFVLFFQTTAAASLAGGTVHGFPLDQKTLAARMLWPATLIAIGGAALAAWAIGAYIQFPADGARWISRAAMLEFAIYAGAVMLGSQAFSVAVLNYLPAATFLLFAFALAYMRQRDRGFILGAAAMLLTFVAAGVQLAGIGLHPRYFTHNALYHLIQGVSLVMMFASARRLTGLRPC